MITTSDIGDILYRHLLPMGCEVKREGFIPTGDVTSERIVVHPRPLNKGRIWSEGYQEVNWLVPDTFDGHADLTRLSEVERMLLKAMDSDGVHDDTFWTFAPYQSQILAHEELKAHYVNVKVLFRALNTME